jgi:hypothetical protein
MMAKGKSSKTSGAVSKGIHSNVSRKLTNAMRSDYMKSGQRVINQTDALMKGKDIVMTIANPNKSETSKRFIRVRVSGKDYLARAKNTAAAFAPAESR